MGSFLSGSKLQSIFGIYFLGNVISSPTSHLPVVLPHEIILLYIISAGYGRNMPSLIKVRMVEPPP